MLHHLHALPLSPGQRAGRAVERQVAESDLDEGLEQVAEPLEQRPDPRVVQTPQPGDGVGDLHRADVGDAAARDLRRAGGVVQPGPVARRTRREGHGAVDERPDVWLHRLAVLLQERSADPVHEPLVGHVDAGDLLLRRLAVQEVLPLLLGEVADRSVPVEVARLGVQPHVPPVGPVPGDRERAVPERLRVVEQLRQVDVVDQPPALAVRAHAAEPRERDLLGLRVRTLLHRDGSPGRHGGEVERERVRPPDVRLTESAEQHAQHRVRVRGGADGGARVGADALLVDDDRGGQAVEQVDVRARERGHEPLHERAVGLVDHPLRLGGDGAEHERALARAGDPGEHREPPLRQVHVDVAQVVRAGTAHPDPVVPVGRVRVGAGGVVVDRIGVHAGQRTDGRPVAGPPRASRPVLGRPSGRGAVLRRRDGAPGPAARRVRTPRRSPRVRRRSTTARRGCRRARRRSTRRRTARSPACGRRRTRRARGRGRRGPTRP